MQVVADQREVAPVSTAPEIPDLDQLKNHSPRTTVDQRKGQFVPQLTTDLQAIAGQHKGIIGPQPNALRVGTALRRGERRLVVVHLLPGKGPDIVGAAWAGPRIIVAVDGGTIGTGDIVSFIEVSGLVDG